MASNCVVEEFDCGVCKDQLKHPKFIGQCNHTFCKECITKYWVSLRKKKTIPCPQCREQCQIPPDGADGLSSNSLVSSIIEKYHKQEEIRQVKEEQDRCHRAFCDIVSTISNKVIETIISTNDVGIECLQLQIGKLQSQQMAIKTKYAQWQAATNGKSILDADSVANLSSISQELMDLVAVYKESGTKSIVLLKHHRISYFKKIKTLKKVKNVTFPTDRRCESVMKIVNLSDGRFAILGDFETRRGLGLTAVFTMNIYDKTSSPVHRMIEEEVDPATDMAVISTGELVVTRLGKPPIRIFHPDTGAFRDINITHDGEVINKLWSVETDDDDNMFLTTTRTTGSHCHLLVVNPTGDIIQRIELGRNCRMAFSRVNRILNVAAVDRLLRFHWSQNTLKEISPSQHGLEGFSCEDVCIGSCGDLLATGKENGCVMIYQVEDRGGSEEMVWRMIPFKDNAERNCNGRPLVCCEGDIKLLLGYGDKVEAFQMRYH